MILQKNTISRTETVDNSNFLREFEWYAGYVRISIFMTYTWWFENPSEQRQSQY